jgi:hypothetical protein
MHLKELFDVANRIEMYKTSKKLFRCNMIEGSLINTHVLRMISYFRKLGQLDFVMNHELSVVLIFQSRYEISIEASR